jgi:hypothetical protein
MAQHPILIIGGIRKTGGCVNAPPGERHRHAPGFAFDGGRLSDCARITAASGTGRI